MTKFHQVNAGDADFIRKSIEACVRIGLIALLVVWSFLIVRAFINPVLWGIIIAIGFYPLHQKLSSIMGNRVKLSAIFLTLFALSVLIVPMVLLTDSTINGIQIIKTGIENDTLRVPPPSDKVAGWPVIGKPIDSFWRLASENSEKAISQLMPYIKTYGKKVFSVGMGLGMALIQFIVSIFIAGLFLVNSESSAKAVHQLFRRVAGEEGDVFADLSGRTINSVVQGVLGVAVIQAVLAGGGMLVVGVPFAGLWALMVLFLAIVQLPPLLVLGPIVVYVFSVQATTPAVIFMIWSVFVSLSDAFLKPFLLGRGVEVPMLVILLGAIGGMIMSGVIGLFIGPVVLSISYKTLLAWIENDPNQLRESEVTRKQALN
ncbi:MAG: AI-2E family transporter [Desulfobacteraceae bacterium]|nr:MAG: AI-2E family transporter [Desulfobacteraceae bacterium]